MVASSSTMTSSSNHQSHHSNTGSLKQDEVFILKPKSQLPCFSKYLNNHPGSFLALVVSLTLGWPLYLTFNISGHRYDRFAYHYDPYSRIYSDQEHLQILILNMGILAAVYGLVGHMAAHGVEWGGSRACTGCHC